jgi:hypothetical protein
VITRLADLRDEVSIYRHLVFAEEFSPLNRGVCGVTGLDIIEGPTDFSPKLGSFLEALSSKPESPLRHKALVTGHELKLRLDEFIEKRMTSEVLALNKLSYVALDFHSTSEFHPYLPPTDSVVRSVIDGELSLSKAKSQVRGYLEWLQVRNNSPRLANALLELEVLELMGTITEDKGDSDDEAR